MNTLELHAQIFKALSEPVRLRILSLLLKQSPLCVCDIVNTLSVGQSLVSRHLNTLKQAQIVTAKREGAWMHYRITKTFRQNNPLLLQQLEQIFMQSEHLQKDFTCLQQHAHDHSNCQIKATDGARDLPEYF